MHGQDFLFSSSNEIRHSTSVGSQSKIYVTLVTGVSDIPRISCFLLAFPSLVYFRQCQKNKNQNDQQFLFD